MIGKFDEANEEAVLVWLNSQFDSNGEVEKNLLARIDLAIADNRMDVVAWLINKNDYLRADVFLHYFATKGFVEAIKWLKKEFNADVNVQDNEGRTPMFAAAASGKTEVIKCLAELGADVNAKGERDMAPMLFAVVEEQTESIKCLAELGADVNIRDNNDLSPMDVAAIYGKTESIKCLAELGADVNAKDDSDWTPMHHAAVFGQAESIKCLAALGADVNARDNLGNTPILAITAVADAAVAAAKVVDMTIESTIGIMECLKSLGAKLDAKNNNGMTLVTLATNIGKLEIVEWLRGGSL